MENITLTLIIILFILLIIMALFFNNYDNYETEIKSIYAEKKLIDENGCYNPIFNRCPKKNGQHGYEIYTPVQQGCLYPEQNMTHYDTAYAVVDNYLNQLPADGSDGTNINNRKEVCANKPSVRDGLLKFGLCNKQKLEERCKLLTEQSPLIADLNQNISTEDINTGIDNMKHIYKSCFNDDLICE